MTPPMQRGDRVLVTGGAGFIGSHLCAALAKDHEVVVVDDLSAGRPEHLAGLPVRLVQASVLDVRALADAARGCSTLFHIAALTSPAESVAEPARYSRVNLGGTANVLDAALACGIRRVVLASTSAVYGDTGARPASEDLPVSPLSPYASTKVAGEALCREWSVAGRLTTVALRFFNVYGPRQRLEGAYASVIPAFARALLAGRAPTIFGDGEQTRDFVHVRDAVRFALAAARAAPEAVAGQAFNAGTGRRVTVNEVFELVRKATGSSLRPIHGPARPGEILHSVADPSRAAAALGVSAEVPLEQGVPEVVSWLRGMPA